MNYRKKVKFLVARKGLFQNLPISNYTEDTSEIKLWRAVVDRGVVDMLNSTCPASTTEWFAMDNEDFLEVCNMAKLTPCLVKETASNLRCENISYEQIVLIAER